jgi:energy-coupling factor transporter ATP-binding protein EcfA2
VQIRAIVLFGKNGQRRDLWFELGKVNIITGKSGTGKSALISIVDYCLGGKFEVADGPIRDQVEWYGVLLQYPQSQLLIARKGPGTAQGTGACYYDQGTSINLPASIGEPNTTMDALEELLTSKLGITENLHTPPPGQTRSPVSAHIRHALTLSFQEQDEIATRRRLFHQQNEYFRMLHFKDTLPYFLGVVAEDAIQLEQQLRDARRALRLHQRTLKDEQDLRGEGVGKAISLISEAREEGLLPPTFNESLDQLDEVVQALRQVLEWRPEDVPFEASSNASALQREHEELEERSAQIREEMEAAEVYTGSTQKVTTLITVRSV